MSQMLALSLIVAILYIGDAISIRTKAWVPSVFVCAVLFLLGYWTFFPADIVSIAGIPQVVAVMFMYLLIVNMGTLLSLRELVEQWKTVLISLTGILGIMILIFIVGNELFDMNTVLVTIPPFVGGILSALIMSKGAAAANLGDLSIFAVLLYVMQGFVGYPLTAIMLQREGKRVLAKYRQGQWKETAPVAPTKNKAHDLVAEDNMPKMLSFIPKQYNTNYFKFLRLAALAYLAYLASDLLKPILEISPFVLCLLFGVIAASCGFLEKQPLQKANGFGLAIMALMLYIFDTLNRATPETLLRLLYPMVVLIITGVIGLFIGCWIMGKILKISTEMSFAIGLTALYGFPADFIITNEAINALTKDAKERQVLTSHMLGPMLVGGFISVTIVSVVLAGFMVGHLTPFVG